MQHTRCESQSVDSTVLCHIGAMRTQSGRASAGPKSEEALIVCSPGGAAHGR
jgi:hypothetical protein